MFVLFERFSSFFNNLTYLELLVLHQAEGQDGSVVGGKNRLDHTEHIGEKCLALLPEPHPLPRSLKSGHESHRVHPEVRQVLAGQRMLGLITWDVTRVRL